MKLAADLNLGYALSLAQLDRSSALIGIDSQQALKKKDKQAEDERQKAEGRALKPVCPEDLLPEVVLYLTNK